MKVTNRYKGLALVRAAAQLWTEACNTAQETGSKTIPKKKKGKKAKRLSEEALRIAVNRREEKGKEKRKEIFPWMQSSKE